MGGGKKLEHVSGISSVSFTRKFSVGNPISNNLQITT